MRAGRITRRDLDEVKVGRFAHGLTSQALGSAKADQFVDVGGNQFVNFPPGVAFVKQIGKSDALQRFRRGGVSKKTVAAKLPSALYVCSSHSRKVPTL